MRADTGSQDDRKNDGGDGGGVVVGDDRREMGVAEGETGVT